MYLTFANKTIPWYSWWRGISISKNIPIKKYRTIKLANHHFPTLKDLVDSGNIPQWLLRWQKELNLDQFNSVQSLSCVRLFVTPWTAARQASPSITNSQSLLKLMSIESVMLSNHLILCRPLLPPSNFSRIRVFSYESVLHIRWPKNWSFSFNISPSNEHSGLISFRMDWLDLLVVQGTLKNLLQHHNSKVSILLHSAFFIV